MIMQIFTPSFDRRVYIFLLVILATTAVGIPFALYALWPGNVEAGYAPKQPIDYSHKLHVGELGMDCLYCHTGADRNAVAQVPSLATCMKCHSEVQTTDSKGELTANMQKLLEHWDAQEPIRWVNVHNLSDFVYFDHGRHVGYWDPEKQRQVKRMECQECHGPVEEMEVMSRHASLKMGWCLDCHKQEPQPDTSPGLATRGPLHCSACHR
jgi:hypothetical protein